MYVYVCAHTYTYIHTSVYLCMYVHACVHQAVQKVSCAWVHVYAHMCASCCGEGVCGVSTCVCAHMGASCCAEGIVCSRACVCTRVCIPPRGGDTLCTDVHVHTHALCSAERVCEHTHAHIPLCRVSVLHTRVHTHTPHSAETMCTPRSALHLIPGEHACAHACAVASPPLLHPTVRGGSSPPPSEGRLYLPSRLPQPPFPRCPPEPDIYILIFSRGGNALRCKCLHCGCT